VNPANEKGKNIYNSIINLLVSGPFIVLRIKFILYNSFFILKL
jgi:hypothetical protein